jgi:hypothetical protein
MTAFVQMIPISEIKNRFECASGFGPAFSRFSTGWKIYQIETVPGNAGNPPVRISFQDMNGDGRLDMLVQIGDGSATLYVTLFNNGSGFVSKL